MTGRLIGAGRTLAAISQVDIAGFVGLPVESLSQMEAKGSARIDSQEYAERIGQGLDQIGIVIVGETGGLGAWVRLTFTRQDVRQVTRLENEGGNVGCDSAPLNPKAEPLSRRRRDVLAAELCDAQSAEVERRVP